MEKYENLCGRILDDINGWLKFAEVKNGMLFAAGIGALTYLQSVSDRKVIDCNLYFAMIVLLGISIVISLLSFFAKMKQPGGRRRHTSKSFVPCLLYYGDIALLEPRSFACKLASEYLGMEIQEDENWDLLLDYSGQIVTNSRIAVRKMLMFNWGMTVYIVFWILLLYVTVI